MVAARQRQKQTRTKNGVKSDKYTNKTSKMTTGSSGLVASFFRMDEYLTRVMGVCSTKDSSLIALRPLMKLLELSCHGLIWLPLLIVVLLTAHQPDRLEVALNLLCATLFDLVVVFFIKMIVRRKRPNLNQRDMFFTVSVDDYGFPSGHASRAGMLAFFLTIHVFSNDAYRACVVAWTITVTVSRVLLNRHYVSDVIIGFSIGILEYYFLVAYWVPQETCLRIMEPYLGHFHL